MLQSLNLAATLPAESQQVCSISQSQLGPGLCKSHEANLQKHLHKATKDKTTWHFLDIVGEPFPRMLRSAMQGGDSGVLEGALANALTGLGADPEGAQRQWLGVYKMALPGSARLLRQLSASLAERAVPLLRSPTGEQALTSLLQVQPRLKCSLGA